MSKKIYLSIFLICLSLANNIYADDDKYMESFKEISINNLPITEDDCDEADRPLCTDYEDDENKKKCYKICLLPNLNQLEFLIYDQISDKIYFGLTMSGGSGGYSLLIFSKDVKTKEIKKFIHHGAPLIATLSPSGQYLSLDSSYLTVIDTWSNQSFEVKDNDKLKNNNIKYTYTSIADVTWINNDKLKYKVREFEDKFAHEPKVITEKELDIRSHKTRELSRNYY